MVHYSRLLLLFLLPGTGIYAQVNLDFPRSVTDLELETLHTPPSDIDPTLGITDPPTEPVRAMAEWEELSALAISWYANDNARRNLLTEIVRAAREECRVIVICADQNVQTQAKNYLINKGVDVGSNVEFLIAPYDNVWIRDYGPNVVYANDVDSLYIIDWIYNRPRYKDDAVPGKIGQYLGVPVYSTVQAPYDLVNTGGNFMSDGIRTGFSSKLVLRNNDQTQNGECSYTSDIYGTTNHTEASIDGIMRKFMGIERYIKFEELPYDCIHHIDMHVKLLDEETMLLGQYPDNVADGPQIEANLAYLLDHFPSAYGTPYKVVRIPMPPDFGNVYPDNNGSYRTYVNSVFVNKTILVPYYETQFDTTALRIWQEAMPGYRIVGIDCNSIIQLDGALHCITKEIGVADPLRIVHQPLSDIVQNSQSPLNYPVYALLQHRNGVDGGRVWYTTDTSSAWQAVDMTPFHPADTADVWVGYIPRQQIGQTVYYYIEAKADGGQKTRVRPMPAPKGWWKFFIQGDASAAYAPQTPQLQPIFPNPATALTCIPVQSAVSTSGGVYLINALGQVEREIFSGNIPAGASRYYFDAGAYPPGAYFIELRTEGHAATQRIVIR